MLVEVRQAGMNAGEALRQEVVTAGALGRFGPFSAEIAFDPPTSQGLGALVLTTDSAANGSTLEATVIALNFSGSPAPTTLLGPPAQGRGGGPPGRIGGGTAPGQTEVSAFFLLRGFLDDPIRVTRSVPSTAGVMRAAMDQLLAGPTEAEQADGLGTAFLPGASGKLGEVKINSDGEAVVDLPSGFFGPGVGTTTGSSLLLRQLDTTVFQFPTVGSVEYRLDGSCEAFFEALQLLCQVIERPSS